MGRIFYRGRMFIALLALTLSVACTTQYRNHGYTPPDSDLETLVVGVDTRSSVEEKIGRPASTGILRESGWYYVSSRVRHRGALAPKTVERQVVAISFGEDDVLTNVERFGLERGRVVALSRRVTNNEIDEITLIEQMIRNFGRMGVGGKLNSDEPPG